jgi:hypothetical protein
LCPGEHCLEHQKQRRERDAEAEHRVQHNAVEPPGKAVRLAWSPNRRVENAVGLALGGAQLSGVGLEPGAFGGRQPMLADRLIDAREKIARAAPPHGDGRHHGDTELSGEPV